MTHRQSRNYPSVLVNDILVFYLYVTITGVCICAYRDDGCRLLIKLSRIKSLLGTLPSQQVSRRGKMSDVIQKCRFTF